MYVANPNAKSILHYKMRFENYHLHARRGILSAARSLILVFPRYPFPSTLSLDDATKETITANEDFPQ
jgi:hypothetical protein